MIALSGGVDSAVSAWLLQQQGYLVKGIYMRTWMHEEGILADCPWQDDMQSARSVADHLGIEFEVINMINHYQDHVVRELIEGYKHGITPNPDIICNQHIKFGALLDYALKQGYMLATGHYVQKKEIAPNTFHLLESPQDSNHQTKDQSYFLCFINKETPTYGAI